MIRMLFAQQMPAIWDVRLSDTTISKTLLGFRRLHKKKYPVVNELHQKMVLVSSSDEAKIFWPGLQR